MRRASRSLIAAAIAAGFAAAPASARVGVTSVTDGEPLGQPPTQAERVLRVGIDIQASERVTTKADDRAHVVFLDGTALTIGPNSVLVIDKYVQRLIRLADRHTIIERGRVAWQGTSNALDADHGLWQRYVGV